MRLCANVPAQHAIQTALGGYQSINDLILPGGRLLEQRNKAYDMLNAIPGVSTSRPRGAMYLFPKLDPEVYHIRDDEKFVLDLLREQKILVSHGRAFNWVRPDHFRMVTLPQRQGHRRSDRPHGGLPEPVQGELGFGQQRNGALAARTSGCTRTGKRH